MLQKLLVLMYIMCTTPSILAQTTMSRKHVFRDSLDGAFDFSKFLVSANGFIPLPFLITEPALGGFGGGMALTFIKKQPPTVDTIRSQVKVVPTRPTVTGVAAAYTANDTWMTGAIRSGFWRKLRTKYRIAGAFANVNLSFFRTLENGEEKEFDLNMRTVPVTGYLMKQFKGSDWSAGLQYTFLRTKVKPGSGNIPEFIKDKEINSAVSVPGLLIEYDSRDNIFTPDKGLRLQAGFSWSDEVFGSDYSYTNLDAFAFYYHSFSKNVVGGFRYEMQQVFEDPPFYLIPYVDLRGIPVMRYQGNVVSVVEAEVRWDFTPRWSVVAFGGTGKAHDSWSEFTESDYNTSGGLGFRYLMARLFKLRMGVDVARGPEDWGYYIVMGTAWVR